MQKQTIQNCLATAAETEEIGIGITKNLEQNRDKIQAIQSKVNV